MATIFSVLIIVSLAIVITRVASVALSLTGVSRELARFQARSALTGAGFTTRESESVVDHPVRRRIIALLMLLGNAGIITAVASLVVSFVEVGRTDAWWRIVVLVVGIAVLWALARSQWLEQRLNRCLERLLDRWTEFRIRDYTNMLHLTGDYRISELQIRSGDWLADRKLDDLSLAQEGVHVLGITRCDGDYVGAPAGGTWLEDGDRVLIYGRSKVIDELDERRAGTSGDDEHRRSVARERQRIADEQAR